MTLSVASKTTRQILRSLRASLTREAAYRLFCYLVNSLTNNGLELTVNLRTDAPGGPTSRENVGDGLMCASQSENIVRNRVVRHGSTPTLPSFPCHCYSGAKKRYAILHQQEPCKWRRMTASLY